MAAGMSSGSNQNLAANQAPNILDPIGFFQHQQNMDGSSPVGSFRGVGGAAVQGVNTPMFGLQASAAEMQYQVHMMEQALR